MESGTYFRWCNEYCQDVWVLLRCILHLIVRVFLNLPHLEVFPFLFHHFLFTVTFKQAQVKIKAVIYNKTGVRLLLTLYKNSHQNVPECTIQRLWNICWLGSWSICNIFVNSLKILLHWMRNYLYEIQAFKLAYAVNRLGHVALHS